MIRYFCCGDERRAAVEAHPTLNGIDFLEVDTDQHRLLVRFLKPLQAGQVGERNISISGGIRVRGIRVTSAQRLGVLGEARHILVVRVEPVGDFSPYTLKLAFEPKAEWLDPRFAEVAFSFKVDCPTDFDCLPQNRCATPAQEEPEIDYLARDFQSFSRLMLDRMSATAPQWQERNPADLGVALVELFAYLGDHLSYRQDAISTEAHLPTARHRISVRRHARLVDYFMHDGANARTWVHVTVDAQATLPPGTLLATRVENEAPMLAPGSKALDRVVAARPIFFETMPEDGMAQGSVLWPEHNEIHVYTWGNHECCLPAGATAATLVGHLPNLQVGSVLLFEEVVGPRSGETRDADARKRHVVRLTRVPRNPSTCEFVGQTDPLTGTAVTEVEWAEEDALPFPVCISTVTDRGRLLDRVSVVRGNMVPADHGRTSPSDALRWHVPRTDERLRPVDPPDSTCERALQSPLPVRFRPALPEPKLTQVGTVERFGEVDGRQSRLPFDAQGPATGLWAWSLRHVAPAIYLTDNRGGRWWAVRDLVSSHASAPDFVIEVDDDGLAHLRFGDGTQGLAPTPEGWFEPTWRVGNGAEGNIGCDALYHIVGSDSAILGVRNPLPGQGGTDPETLEHARQMAPQAFRVQERAVTPQDHADLALRHPRVQRAVATLRWTGSWHTTFLAVDRFGGRPLDGEFVRSVRAHMERYRLAGDDLEIRPPIFVPLEIELHVCVLPSYYRSHVKAALLDVLQAGWRADGQMGLFHPDRFSFGQTVYSSALYAAAHAVPGVESVRLDVFRRHGTAGTAVPESLPMGPLEVPRLDNDPNTPERGTLLLHMDGGR